MMSSTARPAAAVKVGASRRGGAGILCGLQGSAPRIEAAAARIRWAVEPLLEGGQPGAVPMVLGLPSRWWPWCTGPAAGGRVSWRWRAACRRVGHLRRQPFPAGLHPGSEADARRRNASALVAPHSIPGAGEREDGSAGRSAASHRGLRHGLVSSVHPAGELETEARAVIERLASGPAAALRKTRCSQLRR